MDLNCSSPQIISGTLRLPGTFCRCSRPHGHHGSSQSVQWQLEMAEFDSTTCISSVAIRPCAYSQSKLANLIFARELNRRSREAGWGVLSNAVHPGMSKPDPQFSGPEHSMDGRFLKLSQRFMPFMWQEIDDGIKPALYAANSPQAVGGAFYGPHGLFEAAGGGVRSEEHT